MNKKERSVKLSEVLIQETETNKEACLWMSFWNVETNSSLGVIVTKTLGPAHAVVKTQALGINPGGAVAIGEIDEAFVSPEHFDVLLTRTELESAGYIKPRVAH